jgi:hypothetical protein
VPKLPPDQAPIATQNENVGWLELRVYAEMLEDALKAHAACANRANRAPGVDPGLYKAQLDSLAAAVKECRRGLELCYRRVVPPGIRAWVETVGGVGSPSMARLLGVIGHPVHTVQHEWTPHGPVAVAILERRVSDLWSYCGHGDPTRRRREGMSQAEAFTLGSPRAKSLVRVIAGCAVKQPGRTWSPELGGHASAGCDCSKCVENRKTKKDKTAPDANVRAKPTGVSRRGAKPATPTIRGAQPKGLASVWLYRSIYDEARTKYADAVNEKGEPLTDKHRDNRALRLVGKHILKDLWIAAQE